MKRLARALWSNPPTHGARIAAEVVGDAGMFEQWKGEVRRECVGAVSGAVGPLMSSTHTHIRASVLSHVQMAAMAGRIARVRGELQAALEQRCQDKDWSFITQQIGMFSYTGMTPQQVRCVNACARCASRPLINVGGAPGWSSHPCSCPCVVRCACVTPLPRWTT
jgi:aspartate aminotransferase